MSTSAAILLRTWRDSHRITNGQLATLITAARPDLGSCSRRMAQELLLGNRTPSMAMATKILEATGIPIGAWAPTRDAAPAPDTPDPAA